MIRGRVQKKISLAFPYLVFVVASFQASLVDGELSLHIPLHEVFFDNFFILFLTFLGGSEWSLVFSVIYP